MLGQVPQGDGGNDGGPPPRVGNTGHRSLTHRRVALKDGGDCVRRDFHPSGDNYIIGAPQNTQRRSTTVLGRVWGGGHERAVIVGAVPPAPVGINEEMRCGARVIAHIPAGKVLTTKPNAPDVRGSPRRSVARHRTV